MALLTLCHPRWGELRVLDGSSLRKGHPDPTSLMDAKNPQGLGQPEGLSPTPGVGDAAFCRGATVAGVDRGWVHPQNHPGKVSSGRFMQLLPRAGTGLLHLLFPGHCLQPGHLSTPASHQALKHQQEQKR